MRINLGVVDLGKVDLLVDQGYYSHRTDFIRTAIRNQLHMHRDEVGKIVTEKIMVVGVVRYDARGLQELMRHGEQLAVRVVGLFHLRDDVTPELAQQTIQSVKVLGVFRASDQVKAALAPRIR